MTVTKTNNSEVTRYWKSILLCAVLLPACLTLVNHSSLQSLAQSSDLRRTVTLAVSMLIQLALSAWILSVVRLPPWLRTLIYVWCLSLTNIHLLIMAFDSAVFPNWRSDSRMTVAALLGGEIGVLCVWAIMGQGSALIRVPACTVLMSALWLVWTTTTRGSTVWTTALLLEVLALVSLCAVLKFVGFQMHKDQDELGRSAQFGMRDMFVGTTLLAVVFAVLRSSQQIGIIDQLSGVGNHRLWICLLGVSTAFCMITAIWSALGKEGTVLRCIAFLALVCVAGGFHWYDSEQFIQAGKLVTAQDWERYRAAQLKAWWFAWFLISPSVLLTILLFFRFGGYRLSRGSSRFRGE